MRYLAKLTKSFLLASALAVASTYGATFDYSYTFLGGGLVAGSFDGTQNGNLITGITNASLFINGNSLDTGAGIFAEGYDASHHWQNGLAQVSIDGTQNSFLFVNANYAQGQSYTGAFLSISNGPGNPSLMQGEDRLHGFYDYNLSVLTANNWKVTSRSTQAVPDSGSTAVLLTGAFIGLVTLRRRFAN